MSDHDNVYKNNAVQTPMFAPVTQGSKFNDDIDLSDIFAEYFNDSEENYTSISNIVSGGQQQQQQATISNLLGSTNQATTNNVNVQVQGVPGVSNIALPTGRGIKTAWHNGVLPNMQNGGDVHHLQKKQKLIQQSNLPQSQDSVNSQLQNLNSNVTSVNNTLGTGGSALSGRLGFNVVGGQLTMPQKNIQMQQPTPQAQDNKSVTTQGGINLPVGVGIRLGSRVPNVASTGGVTLNHTHWGPGSAIAANGGVADKGKGGLFPTGPGVASEQAMAERRLRNREHAKRSRVRKKFLLESLQQEVRELQKENENLRRIVQTYIPQESQRIIGECCKESPLFGDDGTEAPKQNKVELVKSDFNLVESLTSGQQNFVLSDPRLPDNPIVYASEGFYQLTGYTREQVLGRNCRFLQGPGTDPKAVDVIRSAVANGTDATTCLLNYKADGTPFWNQFFVAALRDSDNCIVNYVGVQCAVEPDDGASALEDKVNAVLPLQHKSDETPQNET